MIGKTIHDRYTLKSELGQGGMGKVYLANDNLLDRDVAIKLLSSARLGTEGRSRLLVEAQTVAKLKHPNIVTVYDAGKFEHLPYVIMEYVQGLTLNKYQPDGLDHIIDIARQICAALQHAHDQGIVHRDLKPENVIIEEDGSVRLMDFGLAVSTATRMTEDGMISGTVFYMSPEQAFGYEITPQSDLYSLGVILYELTTGRLPFEAEDALAVITQHIHAPVLPPRAKNELIPIPLNDLIVSMMSKEPSDRPKSALEVSQMLDEAKLVKTDEVPSQELYVLDRIVRGRIVGRQKEFAEARHLWTMAASGQGQTLLISGEPGIGKTRLMREVITHAEVSGGNSLIGDCYAESNAPYNAFAQVIRQALNRFSRNGLEFPDSVLDDLLKLTPDQRYQYPQIQANPSLDPETEQQRLFENMVTFCNLLSGEFPLLLVIEDVHWGDSGTMKMLHHLIRRTQKRPVMILATYREIELKKSRPFNQLLLELNRQRLGRRMKLDRLNREQTKEMLAEIFAEDITPEFLDGIYHETDGNPFFIEEVCRTLVESGTVYFADGQWHRPDDMADVEIPQGVQIAVETRLNQLPDEHQEILSMASILGREFNFEILMKALDVDEDTLIEALEDAEEAQMIQEVEGQSEITFSFVHALVPSAIIESIRTLRRRKLHRKVAQAMEELSPSDYGALAYHFGEAGREGMALKYYILAGERASEAFANQDAEEHFLAALDLVETDNDKAKLLVQLGLSQVHQNKNRQAIDTWKKAIDLYREMGDLDKIAELYARSGRATWDDGDTKAELEICRRGLSLVEGVPDGPGLARLLAETARACYFNGLHKESELYGKQALKIAQELELPAIQAETLTTLGLLPDRSGEEAVGMLKQAIEFAESANLPRQASRAHNNIAVQYFLKLGDFPRAFEHVNLAAEIAQQIGDRESELFYRVNHAGWMIVQGQLLPVAEMIPSLEELLESLPDRGAGKIGLNQVKANLLYYQGNHDQALELLHDRYNLAHKVGDLQRLRGILFTMALISLIRKEFERGKNICEEMIQLANRGMTPISLSHSLLSMIYSRDGEVERARQLLDESLKEAQEPSSEIIDQAFALWAQADLHVAKMNWGEAWVKYDELMNLLTRWNLLWFQNWLSVEWADAHHARNKPGDKEQALKMLKEAQKKFKAMGADGYVSIVQARLQALN